MPADTPTYASGGLGERSVDREGRPVINSPRKEPPVDVVAIGCGAGGGVIAKELGEASLSVVVLEAGKRFNPETDYSTDRADFELHAPSVFDPQDARRDLSTTSGAKGFHYNRAKGVGGSTLHYLAISPRFHESDFRVYTEDGDPNGRSTRPLAAPLYHRRNYVIPDGDCGDPECIPIGAPSTSAA